MCDELDAVAERIVDVPAADAGLVMGLGERDPGGGEPGDERVEVIDHECRVRLDQRLHVRLEPEVDALGEPNVDTVLVAGREVKRDGKLLYAQIADKKAALQKSGERVLTDFGLLPLRAA
ncbi:MAG TPA: hypothetical protein VIV58_03720 [Kofleriaceae bacterium]